MIRTLSPHAAPNNESEEDFCDYAHFQPIARINTVAAASEPFLTWRARRVESWANPPCKLQGETTHEQLRQEQDAGPFLGYAPAGPARPARSNSRRADFRRGETAAASAWPEQPGRGVPLRHSDRFSALFCQSTGPDSPGGKPHLDCAGRSGRRLDH